jgi:hypothetical protein
MTHLTYTADQLVEKQALEALAHSGGHIVDTHDVVLVWCDTFNHERNVNVKVLDHA